MSQIETESFKKVKASPKINTIKKNCEFQQIFEKGHSINGRYLVVYFLHNQFETHRFGFCVGKKLGSAVMRNRMKRLLREAVRVVYRPQNSGWDIVLVARKPILTARYQDIIKDYEHILLKTGILNE